LVGVFVGGASLVVGGTGVGAFVGGFVGDGEFLSGK
jgi:hypothetical protein